MLQYKRTLYHLNLKILLWGYLVVGVPPALLKRVPQSKKKKQKLTWSLFILCMGQKNASFWEEVFGVGL